MGMMTSFAMLLIFVLGGGGNDLLDYAQTDAYWKAKGVTVSVEQLTGELVPPKADDVSKLIRQLGAEDPAAREAATQKILQAGSGVLPQLQEAAGGANREVANRAANLVESLRIAGKGAGVRRLMAIRTLGELKKPEAVAGLKPLLDSKEPFVAEYAANAIAAIEGKPGRRAGFPDKARTDDLNLLPAKVDGVAQVVFGNGSAGTIEQLIGAALNLLPADQRVAMFAEVTAAVVEVAEKMGNVRLDQATGGLFSNAPNAPGWGVIVLRGRWDAAALSAATEQAAAVGATAETVDGFRVFRDGKTAALVVVSDEMAVLVVGDQQGVLPVDSMIAAVKKGTNDFAANESLAKLLAGVEKTSSFWLAVNATDGLRQVAPPQLKPFDTIWITLNRKADVMEIRWQGNAKDPEAIKGAAAEILRNADEGVKNLGDAVKMMPALQSAVDFLKSVRCTTDGGKLEGGATLKNPIQLLPVMFMGAGSSATVEIVPPPPPEVLKPDKRQ